MDLQLVADVGNTETVFGLVTLGGEKVVDHWRVSTTVPRTEAEYGVLLSALLARGSHQAKRVRRGVVASVVPSGDRTLRSVLASVVDGVVYSVNAASDLPITLDVEEPLTVGADRIVNTLAAKALFRRDTIVVDLGTATTFDCITGAGVFRGGVIAPGASAGLDWLARSTAKLPLVELTPPAKVVGRRTETCIQSGVFYSVVDAVDGIVGRIRESWARPDPLVVATGGHASVIAPHTTSVHRIEPLFTLHGLGIAGAHLASRTPGVDLGTKCGERISHTVSTHGQRVLTRRGRRPAQPESMLTLFSRRSAMSAVDRIQPLADRVVVKALEEAEQMRGGLYIPDTAKEKPQEGEVVAVGPGKRSDDGTRVPMDVSAGARVLYGKYSGTEVTVDGGEYLILRESDILAVLS